MSKTAKNRNKKNIYTVYIMFINVLYNMYLHFNVNIIQSCYNIKAKL